MPALLQQQESVGYNSFSMQAPMINALNCTPRRGDVPMPLTFGTEIYRG